MSAQRNKALVRRFLQAHAHSPPRCLEEARGRTHHALCYRPPWCSDVLCALEHIPPLPQEYVRTVTSDGRRSIYAFLRPTTGRQSRL
jgi:hypothetical protein